MCLLVIKIINPKMLREIYPCVHVIILVYIDHVFLDKSDIIIINICKGESKFVCSISRCLWKF